MNYGGIRHFKTPTQQLVSVGHPVDLLTDIPSFALVPVSHESVLLLLKRLVDFLSAIALLLILSPVFLVLALLIKLTSQGPVFFKQERIGHYRRPFTIWKFRTMLNDAESRAAELRQNCGGDVFFKLKNDPRVTPIGRVMRKYSLDELPQLFNVLSGEMSLVGPRPICAFEMERFGGWNQLRRFDMKPGLTCIWQVSGRSNTTDAARMNYDLQYVEDWSLLLDFKLLLRTVPVVVKGDGAV
ncbi:MAG TPA: sugar transferase [Pyrinomonadaceae bacterium]|jgi:exopolysaccharide biosynthesis polyprenyl glycosylphosphotransferase